MKYLLVQRKVLNKQGTQYTLRESIEFHQAKRRKFHEEFHEAGLGVLKKEDG